MELEDLMLKKEEIPILYEHCFQMPIHPRLLDKSASIDKNLANRVFPIAAEEWYNEMIEYSRSLKDEKTKKWIDTIFLKKKPKIKREFGGQRLDSLYWRDEVLTTENGFAYALSISRDAGGSLYFRKDEMNCETFCVFDSRSGYIRFTKDKALEFKSEDEIIKFSDGMEGVRLHAYGTHNIDYYPGALFLRNWARLYLNEAIKWVLNERNSKYI